MELCPRCGTYGTRYVSKVDGRAYVYFAHRRGGKLKKCYIGPLRKKGKTLSEKCAEIKGIVKTDSIVNKTSEPSASKTVEAPSIKTQKEVDINEEIEKLAKELAEKRKENIEKLSDTFLFSLALVLDFLKQYFPGLSDLANAANSAVLERLSRWRTQQSS